MLLRLLIVGLVTCCWCAKSEVTPLNVILMLVDDLGQTDLGCYGSTYYQTPHIDKLAADGMRFTQASSACTVCSPTRASLLTGKYPARLHLTDWIPGHTQAKAKLQPPTGWAQQLPLEECTLAELFQYAGFATASIGKWHLGGEEFFPDKQGFGLNLGGTHRGQPSSYFSPFRIPTLPDGPEGEFLTEREAAEACRFITDHRSKRFFLYLPHHAVHTPLMGKKEIVEKYETLAKARPDVAQGKAAYAALVESVDDSVGRIRARLEELGLWDSTVFIFTSDNGGLVLHDTTHNLGLRAGKGSAYEGGTRIPLIIRWPGRTKPGGICHTPVITPDLFATLRDGCALKSSGPPVDGASLLQLLAGQTQLPRDAIFWHYPHYHPGGATPYSAVRLGDLKLIHFFEDDRDELYDLKTDPAETTNLAAAKPDSVQALRHRLETWWKETGAQMPEPNPKFDPSRPPRGKKAPRPVQA
ncbi:MAG: sulfatase [Verrucomicrobiales bacterium]|nr:sulfatase [Verrucomicrobiales bacterium]